MGGSNNLDTAGSDLPPQTTVINAEETNPDVHPGSQDMKDGATKTAENPQPEKHQQRRIELVICIFLHLFLVLFHVALLIVWATKAERGMRTSLKVTNTYAISSESLLNGFLQAFYVLLTTAIIFLTQSLALGRQISKPQSLTALADRTTAWGGLGPSGVTLWQNIKIPAALASAMIICGYFATLAALQMTTPILFSLVLKNVTTEQVVVTTVGTPLLADNSTASYDHADYLQNLTVAWVDWYEASSVVNLLGSNPSLSLPGLRDNRIYDTLFTTLPSNGTAVVNYTDFHVTCGTMPSPNISWSVGPSRELYSDTLSLPISFSIAVHISNATFNTSDRIWFNVNSTYPARYYWSPSNVLIRSPVLSTSPMLTLEPPGANLMIYSVYDEGSNRTGPIYEPRT